MTRSELPRMGLISFASNAELAAWSRSISVCRSGVFVVPAAPPNLSTATKEMAKVSDRDAEVVKECLLASTL